MRYWRLWKSFFRASLLADTEYRLNIVLRVLSESVWYLTQVTLFEVLYSHTTNINGWTIHAVRVFQGTLFLVDVLYIVFFSDNLDAINGMVRRGDLDLYLTKPINSQFMISMRRVAVSYLPNIFLTGGYLVWSIARLPEAVTAVTYGAFAVALLCGVLSYYAMRFMFCTLVILMQDAGNVQFLWHQFFRLSTRPDSLYPNALRWALMSILPLAFIASVPARVVTQGAWELAGAAVLVAVTLTLVSGFAWTRALRHYASASS